MKEAANPMGRGWHSMRGVPAKDGVVGSKKTTASVLWAGCFWWRAQREEIFQKGRTLMGFASMASSRTHDKAVLTDPLLEFLASSPEACEEFLRNDEEISRTERSQRPASAARMKSGLVPKTVFDDESFEQLIGLSAGRSDGALRGLVSNQRLRKKTRCQGE